MEIATVVLLAVIAVLQVVNIAYAHRSYKLSKVNRGYSITILDSMSKQNENLRRAGVLR